MTMPVLELILPTIFILAAPVVGAYLKIRYPRPRALGQVLPELYCVASDEITRYDEFLDEEYASKPHLRRTLRRHQILVNRAYLSQMAGNTRLFQQVLRFEAIKIDPGKSSFDYEPRETLIVNLMDEFAKARWELVKAQADLLKRSVMRMTISQDTLMTLLGAYKHLEQQMLTLAGMAEDDRYRLMLVERLGLHNWGVIEGGASNPAWLQ